MLKCYLSSHSPLLESDCPSGYRLNPYTGTCFLYVKTLLNWYKAKGYCEKREASLATFDTLESAAWFRHQQKTQGESIHHILYDITINDMFFMFNRSFAYADDSLLYCTADIPQVLFGVRTIAKAFFAAVLWKPSVCSCLIF